MNIPKPLPWLIAAALLAGCATAPDPVKPLPLKGAQDVGLTQKVNANSREIPARWWTLLGDVDLDALIDKALLEHPSMALAQARAQQASSLAGFSKAATLPSVGLEAAVTRQLYSANDIYPPPLAGNIYDSGHVLVAGSWAMDFFGQHQSVLNAALGQANASMADRAAARTALASQISHAWIRLAQAVEQRGILQQLNAQRQEITHLTTQRVDAGLENGMAQAQSRQSLDTLRAQSIELDDQIAVLRHQLAILSGQPPQALDGLTPAMSKLKLPALPDEPDLDMLGRRPDIVAARWRVEAAGQSAQAARQAFYPNLNLRAFLGATSIGLDRLSHGSSSVWGVSPALSLPLFDSGSLNALWGVRQSELQAAIATYNQTVLEAVRQARDALGTVQSQRSQVTEQTHGLQQAELSHKLATQRWQAGLGNRLNWLTSQGQLLAQKRQVTDQLAAQLDANVALIQALGSWHPEQP